MATLETLNSESIPAFMRQVHRAPEGPVVLVLQPGDPLSQQVWKVRDQEDVLVYLPLCLPPRLLEFVGVVQEFTEEFLILRDVSSSEAGLKVG